MLDLSNPFGASVFLAARPLLASSMGRSVRKFVASFVFAGAVTVVVIAGSNQIEQSVLAANEAASIEQLQAVPEYTAVLAKLEADERAEASFAAGEASAR